MAPNRGELSRSSFMRAGAAYAAAAAAVPSVAAAHGAAASATAPVCAPSTARQNVLLLSGGTAYGAYEAGVVAGLRVTDYDFVCGSSIGALNGIMFAAGPAKTAELSDLWHSIGRKVVLELKPRYRHLLDGSAGVLTRACELVRLLLDATGGTLQGALRSEPVLAILREHLVGPNGIVPLHVPMYWATSDLTAGCAGYFYRLPPPDPSRGPTVRFAEAAAAANFAQSAGRFGLLVARAPDSPEEMLESLRSSTAIPAAFEPSKAPPSSGRYAGNVLVDGLVTSNTPFALVRAAAACGPVNVDVVFLGSNTASHKEQQTSNVKQILIACYDLMTQRLVDDAARALSRDVASLRALRSANVQMDAVRAELESKRRTLSVADAQAAEVDRRLGAVHEAMQLTTDALTQTVRNDVTIRYRAPSTDLAGTTFAFGDQDAVDFNFKLGRDDIDGGKGWMKFTPPDDLCNLTGDRFKQTRLSQP